MKEAVLNKRNPKERKILEAELQKVYTKQTHSFRDAGKAVWNTKGIRELLDGCTEYAGCYFKWQYCRHLKRKDKWKKRMKKKTLAGRKNLPLVGAESCLAIR